MEEYIEAMTFLTFLREHRLLTIEEIQKKLCFQVIPNSSNANVSRIAVFVCQRWSKQPSSLCVYLFVKGHYFSSGGGFGGGGGRGRGGCRPFAYGPRDRPQDAAAGGEAEARQTRQFPAQVAANEEATGVVAGGGGGAAATATPEPVEVRLVVQPLSYLLGVADLTGELMRFAVSRVSRAPLAEALALCSFTQALASGLHRLFGQLPWNQSQAAHKVSALVTNVLKACPLHAALSFAYWL